MSVTTTARTLPRSVLAAYLQAGRLPLTAAQRLAKQQGNEEWPPALVFEGFQGSVESVVGSLLRDEELVDKGRLRQAKVAQLREAIELKTVAEQKQAAAASKFKQRERQIDQRREQAAKQAEQREQQVETQAEKRKREAQEAAERKAATARRAKAAQEKAAERRARADRTAALDAETRALRLAEQAVEADETVEVISDSIDGNKAVRKTS